MISVWWLVPIAPFALLGVWFFIMHVLNVIEANEDHKRSMAWWAQRPVCKDRPDVVDLEAEARGERRGTESWRKSEETT